MKGKRLVSVLSAVLAALIAGGATLCAPAGGRIASAAEDKEIQSEQIEKEISHKISYGGYALNSSRPGQSAFGASPISTISAISIGGFSGSFGAQLSAGSLERTIYDEMVTNYVRNRKTGSIKIPCEYAFSGAGDWEESDEYKQAEEDLGYIVETAYNAFVYDYPELFWIYEMTYIESTNVSVTYDNNGDATFSGRLTAVTISFTEIYAGAKDSQGAFSAAVAEAKAAITASRTDATQYQTVRAIHDYICNAVVYPFGYDPKGLSIVMPEYHSAAGVFLRGGVAVCEGYAKSFMILCREFDIPAILVVGEADGESHMWNYVQMQGSWYAVDTTRDDTLSTDAYFMIGSGTAVSGGTLGTTRVLNTCFSENGTSKNFNYPILNGTAYQSGNVHVHSWVMSSEAAPTCTEEGRITYTCFSCGETTTGIVAALGHSYHNKTYVYNNDATVFSDGTKTLVCDNGCGTGRKTVPAEGTRIAPTITLNATSLKLKRGQSTNALKVSGLSMGDSVKSWASANPKIVRVTSSGKITARNKTETTKIIITLNSGLKKEIKVTVQSKAVAASKISDIEKSITLKKGKTKKLTPTILPITCVQKVTYKSSNTKVATVSASGKIKARKKGKATITVKCGGKTAKCKVVVK